jgi:glycosyltransferase involved in cell wall biosynthesis
MASSIGTLEITTVIGCKVQCKFCPQDLLTRRYLEHSNITQMSLGTFIKCINKVPNSIRIHFSGMAEPWLNPDCTEMLLYASKKGHPISIYTTLVGMNYGDFERIKELDYYIFSVHLPDKTTNSSINIDQNYLSLLERVLQHFSLEKRKRHFEVSCHGTVHPKIRKLIPADLISPEVLNGLANNLIDRAGNLNNPVLVHRYSKGPLQCGLSDRHLNRNILLPDGSILLCCMDYGMNVVLGNLTTMSYKDIFSSDAFTDLQTSLNGDQDVLCRHCNNAIPWQRPYELIDIRPLLKYNSFDIVLQFCAYQAHLLKVDWIACFQPEKSISFSPDEISKAVVLLPDISALLDHPESPSWSSLLRMMDITPAAVLVKPFHILKFMTASERQSQVEKFSSIITKQGLTVDLAGWIRQERGIPSFVAILSNNHLATLKPTPQDYRVIALIATYNEADLIAPVIDRLIQDEIEIYLIDNESTDGTYDIAHTYLGKGLIGLERFSPKNPADLWYEILKRKEVLSQQLDADWFIHNDADEIRESPWPTIGLRDAFYKVEQQGYSCIDFTVLEFRPVDNDYKNGQSLETHFRFFEFSTQPSSFSQVKAWKKTKQRVNLAESGGHRVDFPEARVYPYKFLVRHYPIRSQIQGEEKIFGDRKNKYAGEKATKNWHIHYDHLAKGDNLLGTADSLASFDESFYCDYLIERISGLGIAPQISNPQYKALLDQLAEKDKRIADTESVLEEIKKNIISYAFKRLLKRIRKKTYVSLRAKK